MTSSISISEILDYNNTHGHKKCVEFLIEANKSTEQPTSRAYEISVKKIVNDAKNVKRSSQRNNDSSYEHFLKQLYVFPKRDSTKCVPKLTSTESVHMEYSLKQMKKTSVELLDGNKELEQKVNDLEHKVKDAEEKVGQKDEKLYEYKKQLKRTSAREKYNATKVRVLEDKQNGDCCAESRQRIAYLKQQLKEKEKEISELQASVQYLNDIVNDNETEILQIYDEKSKRYIPSFKTCVYQLLKHNVSASKVGYVIKSVLKLVNVTPNKVPSKPTVLQMNLQRLCLAQQQVIEVFSAEQDTCLLTDETSKFGTKFMGYEASDSTGNLWVLGLREIETKSAENTLKVFNEVLSDLDSLTDSSPSRDIISHISATMSDRAATEVKFNYLLQEYRSQVLPLTYKNFNNFSEAEKSSIESLNNFFCGLHALVNFAETSQKCMLKIEEELFTEDPPILDSSFRQKSEPGTSRLIRTASKAFGDGSGGDEKSGCQGNFKTYVKDFLKVNRLKGNPLKSFRGSRFNILFTNASALFFLHEKMKEFLEQCGADNRLLKAVQFDLNTIEYIAGVKALGLISKFITSPLWCVLEDKSVTIQDMNQKYLELTSYFEDVCKNVNEFMTGNLLVFPEYVKRDCLLDKLLEPQPYDQMVQTYLEVILSALCQLGKKLYTDHLPGGKLTSEPIKAQAAPKTSCFAESIFGQMDQLMRTKPNTSTLAAEASIMFANNKTMEWLEGKNVVEQEECIKKASRNAVAVQRKFKERIYEISENRRRDMEEKIIRREAAQREKLRKQESYTNDIVLHGLWQSREEIDEMLQLYHSSAQKVEALKVQIKFRKEVLFQVPERKSDFNFTKGVAGRKSRKSLSVEELTENLKSLVQLALVKDGEYNEPKHMLVGKRIQHRFLEDRDGEIIHKWYTGKVISQVPSFREWFNVIYDDDDAVYTLRHLPDEIEREDLKIIV